MESAAVWLTYPLALHGSREFECGDMTVEDCDYYKQRWHFWYIADYVFALPTVAFFMSAIGIFILGNFFTSYVFGYRRFRGPSIWRKCLAFVRYLSYRGFHIKALKWNSAPIGVLLLGLVGVIFFFCMDLAPQPYYWADIMFGGSPPLATRSGWLALGCMPFVFATATKTNWITMLTGVSHERLQVFHRWIAYAFFVLALLHTFPFIVYHVHWQDMEMTFSMSLIFYWTGIVAIIFQAWLTFASHSMIRNMNYEFFKATHFFAVVIFIVTFFWHCDYTLTSWDYFIATAAVYVPCYVYPWMRTLFQYGTSQRAHIFVEENGFTRITIPTQTHWKPGQHCFLRFTGFGLMCSLSSHPFTICSSPSTDSKQPSELVFYIRHQRGFTAKLYQHALDNPGVEVPVLVDGPYGGIHLQKYRDSDHALIIAGGSGAGWCLPFVERFLRSAAHLANVEKSTGVKESAEVEARPVRRSSGPLSLRVILATRDISTRVWFLRTVGELISKYPTVDASGDVRVQVYLTGEAAQELHVAHGKEGNIDVKSTASNSSGDRIEVPSSGHETKIPGRETEGRPHLRTIIAEESAKSTESGESLGVYVCGPEGMQHDVRNAVADENMRIIKGSKSGGVYLHSEHFSWA